MDFFRNRDRGASLRNIQEFLEQFSETKEHVQLAGKELLLAFRSFIDVIIEGPKPKAKGESEAKIKKVDIK